MQKKELEEGLQTPCAWNCYVGFSLYLKTVHQYCSPQISTLPKKSSCLIVWCLFNFFLKQVNKYHKSLFMKSGKLEFPLNLTVKMASSLT